MGATVNSVDFGQEVPLLFNADVFFGIGKKEGRWPEVEHFILLILRGTIVNETYGIRKKLYS